MNYLVEKDLLQKAINYLVERPWKDVNEIVVPLSKSKPEPTPPTPPIPPAEIPIAKPDGA